MLVERISGGLPEAPDLLSRLRSSGIVCVHSPGGIQTPQDLAEYFVGSASSLAHPLLPRQVDPGVAVYELRREADAPGAYIFGGAWHQNLTFMKSPPDVTVLFGKAIAGSDSFTAFVDLVEVGQWISPLMAAWLRPLIAVHTTDVPIAPHRTSLIVDLEDGDVDYSESNSHPVMVRDSASGFEWPFVLTGYVTEIEGLTRFESTALIDGLRGLAVHDEFVRRHYWQEGDLLLWDNRRFLHRATVTHRHGERVVWRMELDLGWGLTPAA